MPQSLNIKLRGLYTFPNDFSSVPEGALSVADNIVIDRDSIAEPARGFTYLSDTTGRSDYLDTNDRCQKNFFFKDTIVAHVENDTAVQSLVSYDPATGWASLAALYDQPDADNKVRSAYQNGNLYLTGDLGVHRLDAADATPIRVGVPQSYDIQNISTDATTPVWLENTNSVCYRVVWGYKDLNGNLLLGAPSGRYVFTNSDGVTKSTAMSILIPYGITTDYFFQIYRSPQVVGTPSDELRLVFEGFPTAGNITAGFLTVTDITDEALLKGSYLYTNESQEGDSYGNILPPFSTDIAVYANSMFYANVRYQQTFFLDLMGVNFSQDDTDTITIGATTYKAIFEDDDVDPHFTFREDMGSASLNIRRTAESLVWAINHFQSEYYATYISGSDDLPGKIGIRSSGVGGSPFALTSTISSIWSPPLPVSGTAQSSTDDYAPNGLAFSKTDQPEAVPLPNRKQVGSKDSAILRIIPLRDSLFILKEDGVWRLYGTDPSNFNLALLDSTARCIAPDAAVVLNNMIFALTTQGVVTISETGVMIMSRPIEADLLDLISINPTVLYRDSFAVSYESQRAYYLWVPTLSTDTYPTQYYRYNTVTNNWTRGTLGKLCGGVNPYDDLMYLGNATNQFMDQERKNHNSFDYANYVSTNTISGVTGVTVTITNANLLEVGQVIYQSSLLWGEIDSLVDSTHVKMKYAVAFTNAAADVVEPISVRMKWAPCTFANPGINKQVREISILMLGDFYGVGNVSFESDISPDMEEEECIGISSGPWGQFPWGGAPWGGNAPRRRPLRVGVPRNQQRCSFLTVGFNQEVCFSPWAIQGVSLIGNNISERVWMEGDTV